MAEALPFAADHVGRRHAHVVEMNLPGRVAHHGRPETFEGDARRFHADHETADAAARAFGRIGDRDHLGVIGVLGGGDKSLCAVDNVMIAVFHRAGFHAGGIAAGIGLGLGEANFDLAVDHRQQKTLLLFVVAIEQHRPHFRPEDRRIAKRNRDGARHLFHNDAAAHQIEPRAAVFLRHIEQPETDRLGFFLERFNELLRHVLPFGTALALERNQLAIDELAHRVF